MKRISISLILTFAIFAGACQKEGQTAFEKDAHLRMTEYLSYVQSVLTGAERGWIMQVYFNGRSTGDQVGGYNFTLTFTKDSVFVAGETREVSSSPAASVASLYRLDNLSGPTLSFDTYNSAFADFATPSNPPGLDFCYEITRCEKDYLELKNLRTGKEAFFFPQVEDSQTYLGKVMEVRRAFPSGKITRFNAVIGPVKDIKLSVDIFNYSGVLARSLVLDLPDGSSMSEVFCFTDTGLRLRAPMEVGGWSFDELTWNPEEETLTGIGVNCKKIKQ